jgi:hypothetical protein
VDSLVFLWETHSKVSHLLSQDTVNPDKGVPYGDSKTMRGQSTGTQEIQRYTSYFLDFSHFAMTDTAVICHMAQTGERGR